MRRRFDLRSWWRRPSQGTTPGLRDEVEPDLRSTADALEQSLATPGTPEELAGERTALTAYRAVFGHDTPRAEGRNAPVVVSLAGARMGVAAAGAVLLGLGGLSAAAYSGSLPDAAQNVAHEAIGAPPGKGKAHKGKHGAATPQDASQSGPPAAAVGPDARGPAAHGLCTAFDPAKDKGEARKSSVAYRNLVRAAGGEGKVASYCASVEKARGQKPQTTKAPGRPTDKPTGKATGKPTGKATGKPTGKATGAPSTKPEKSTPSPNKATPSTPASATATSAPRTTTATTVPTPGL